MKTDGRHAAPQTGSSPYGRLPTSISRSLMSITTQAAYEQRSSLSSSGETASVLYNSTSGSIASLSSPPFSLRIHSCSMELIPALSLKRQETLGLHLSGYLSAPKLLHLHKCNDLEDSPPFKQTQSIRNGAVSRVKTIIGLSAI